VEPLAHFFERENRLDRLLDRDRGNRPFDPADEQGQVVPQVVARDEQVRVGGGPIIGHPEADVLVRVSLARLDLGQQLLGPGHLLLPAGRRGVPGLLLGQFPQGWAVEGVHRWSSRPADAVMGHQAIRTAPAGFPFTQGYRLTRLAFPPARRLRVHQSGLH